METKKCPKCQLVNWSSSAVCKRCQSSLDGDQLESLRELGRKNRNAALAVNRGFDIVVTQDVKKDAWKKIKWGSVISIVGFTLTFGMIYIGMAERLNLANGGSKNLVAILSIFTLLPLAAVSAGIIELATGMSIFKIIEKWEELPQWLGWLIGFAVFFLIISVIIFVAAVVIINFF